MSLNSSSSKLVINNKSRHVRFISLARPLIAIIISRADSADAHTNGLSIVRREMIGALQRAPLGSPPPPVERSRDHEFNEHIRERQGRNYGISKLLRASRHRDLSVGPQTAVIAV